MNHQTGSRTVAVTMEPPSDGFAEIEFKCPYCGTPLDRYHEKCPHCGEELGEEFSAMYRPAPSPVARVIALLILIVVVLIPLAAVVLFLLF